MLDTIILQLNRNQYHITDYGRFGTTKEKVEQSIGGYQKWINNPTAKDKEDGIYKPRLTLNKRGRNFPLKIEFSAPKLIFGNNLEELENTDFDEVIKTLRDRLKDMGIIVFSHNLMNAEVLSFHPSKNIVLSKGYTANLVIKELNKVDIGKRFDFDNKNYRNNGEVLQLYTRSHSFVIYDKISDLNKPQKRATDKDQTKKQLSIFDFLQENNKRLEVIRLEVRLSLRRKMNEILKEVNYKTSPNFSEVFNKSLCQTIVNNYWNKFFGKNNFLYSTKSNSQEILQLIFLKFPKTKILTAFKMVGLYMLSREESGISGLRRIVESSKPNINWAFVSRDIKLLEDEIFTMTVWGFINDIKNGLSDFKSLKMEKDKCQDYLKK